MTPTERAAVAEAIAALEPLAQIRFDLDGFSFDMADIVFEGKLLATFRTTLDHHRFSKAVVNAQAALASLRAVAPAPADQSDAGRGEDHKSALRKVIEFADGLYGGTNDCRDQAISQIVTFVEGLDDDHCSVIPQAVLQALELAVHFMRKEYARIVKELGEDSSGAKLRNILLERFTAALASAPSETVGRGEDDFTVTDSILAGAILTQLGFAGQASGSLEPGIDHRRDRIAKMIFAERHRVALSTADRDAIREALREAIAFVEDEREVRGDEDAQYEKPAAPLIEKLAALAKRLEATS